jgi:hypothetical protein
MPIITGEKENKMEELRKLAELGKELRVAERDQVALGHILKARVRDYVGHDALCTGEGEKLNETKCVAAYKYYLLDAKDPVFTNRVCRLVDPWQMCAEEQNRLKKEMGKIVRTMPIWKNWGKDQVGLADSGLGKILANCSGDTFNGPGDFPNPGKLWKFFGLHVLENGTAPRPTRGQCLGFSTYRAGVAYIAGNCLLRAGRRTNKETDEKEDISSWGELYTKRKEVEIQKCGIAGLEIIPGDIWKKKVDKTGFISVGQVHNRAMRYVTKRLFRELWKAWRTA